MDFKPRRYQSKAIDFVLGNESAALLLDPGLGKTVTTLTAFAISRLVSHVEPAIVVAPLNIARSVWSQEASRWSHLDDLKVERVIGTASQRMEALDRPADVYVTNVESVAWLVDNLKRGRRFSLLAVDESTRFKNPGAKCFKALKRLIGRCDRRVILTGTPAPQNYIDLWAQFFILDEGERLGKTITAFRKRYCKKGGFRGKEWLFRESSKPQVEQAIKDISFRIDARDVLELPDLIFNDILVDLPDTIKASYDRFEKELYAEISAPDKDVEIYTLSASGGYLGCRQIANGGIYKSEPGEERTTEHLHNAKVDAIESIANELDGRPLLVFYQFTHDLERLIDRFPKASVIRGGSRNVEGIVDRWNAGKVEILAAQNAAASHGLNLQYGGCRDVVYMGLPDSLEVYEQSYRRVYRQGTSGGPVKVHRVLARGTIDEDIVRRLDLKDISQKSLLNSLRSRYENSEVLREL